jgi:hypothetical protein
MKVEVEGGELAVRNSNGDIAIIPIKYRREAEDMIKEGCHDCLDNLIATLPTASNYAEAGALFEKEPPPTELPTVEVFAKGKNFTSRAVTESTNANINAEAEYKISRYNEQIKIKEEEKRKEEQYKENYKQQEKTQKEKLFIIEDIKSDTDLYNLSKEDIKKVQKELKSKGELTSENTTVDSKNKEDVMELQNLLKSKGYDLGKYGKNKDGVDGVNGKMTKAALKDYNQNKEIDGIVGAKTLQSFRNFKSGNDDKIKDLSKELVNKSELEIQTTLQDKDYFKAKEGDFNYNVDNILLREQESEFKVNKEDKCSSGECAFYVNEQIEEKIKTKGREDIGAYGDAWTIRDNLVASGAESIYNVFPSKKEGNINPNEYISELTNRPVNINPSSLKSGDVVNLYYGGSRNSNKAYEEGSSVFSTHLGIIKKGEDGNLYMEHNVGGEIKQEPINALLNNKSVTSTGKPLRATAITRPNYNIKEAKLYEPTDSKLNLDNVSNLNTSLTSKKAAEGNQVLINNKNVLLKDIPINDDEFNNLVKAVRIIGWKESNYQENPKTNFKSIGSNVREVIGGRESSEGYTQLKDKENLNKKIRENININNESLKDIKKSAIATMYALSTKYLKIKASLNDDVNLLPNELTTLALISWNEPVDKVIETINKHKTLDRTVKRYQDAYGYDENGKTKFPYDLAVTGFNKYIQ